MNFRSKYFKAKLQMEKGAIDITPLVDVVFQLIIFFLLSSSFVLQPGIKVELPTVKLPKGEKPAGLSLSILRDGRIFLNDRPIEWKVLQKALQMEKVRQPDQLLVIKADEKAQHGNVVRVMGLAKEVGFARIAIATKPEFFKSEEG